MPCTLRVTYVTLWNVQRRLSTQPVSVRGCPGPRGRSRTRTSCRCPRPSRRRRCPPRPRPPSTRRPGQARAGSGKRVGFRTRRRTGGGPVAVARRRAGRARAASASRGFPRRRRRNRVRVGAGRSCRPRCIAHALRRSDRQTSRISQSRARRRRSWIGTAASTRSERLRCIQSAEPIRNSPSSGSSEPAAKWKMRECSRKRPMIERMRMFSVSPGTPGARQQRPRTIRSTGTPACEARDSASQISRSSSWFILQTIRAGRPGLVVFDLALDELDELARACASARRAASRTTACASGR